MKFETYKTFIKQPKKKKLKIKRIRINLKKKQFMSNWNLWMELKTF